MIGACMPDDQNPERTTDPFAPKAPEPTFEQPTVTTPFNTVDQPAEPQPAQTSPPTPVTPVAPTTVTPQPIEPVPVGGLAPQPQKKSKRKLIIIGAIVAGIIAILGAGSALAYNLYYQNPQKVVTDALMSVANAKSMTYAAGIDFTSTSASTPVSVTVDLNGGTASNKSAVTTADITVTVEDQTFTGSVETVIGEDQRIYVKANDLENTVADINTALESTAYAGYDIAELFPNTIETLNDNWVEIDLASLDEDTFKEYDEAQVCIQGVLTRYEEDDSYGKEVADAYKANQFILTPESLGSRDINGVASLGYRLDFDKEKLKAFATQVQDTKFIKELNECDDSSSFKPEDIEDVFETSGDTTTRYELWAARFGHELTLFTASAESKEGEYKLGINFSPNLNATPEVTIPTNAISTDAVYDAVMLDIETLQNSFSATSDYSTYEDYDYSAY